MRHGVNTKGAGLPDAATASNLNGSLPTHTPKESRMSIDMVADLGELRGRLGGALFAPGDPGWDEARAPWQRGTDQHPAAVAFPESEDDVLAIVRAASEVGLRVAPQATGHNAAPLGRLDDTILVKTGAMRGVRIDGARRRARVRAGALWQDVTARAAEHGLAGLAGSSPNVGVVGYSLGGGLSWLARRHGLQANRVTAVELVTADGERVRTDHQHDPELFWALRGGGGSFGIVTALEFDLVPVREVYAGALVWDWRHAGHVLLRFSEWAQYATDLITTSARILQLPAIPEVPEPLRDRRVVMIDGAYLGDSQDGAKALEPLRALRPELDTFAAMPAAALQRLHGDPEAPTAFVSEHRMLSALPRDGVEAFVETAGPGSGSSLLVAELRQLGGALGRRPEHHGALPRLDGAFLMYAGGLALDDEMALTNLVHARRLAMALEPWENGRRYRNFEEHPADAGAFHDDDTHARLREVKTQMDPRSLIHANHPIEA
jgi:FAD/FMN-containing dehydrogenase